MNVEIARCRCELDQVEQLIRDGHPDLELLCLALVDWSSEIRELEKMEPHQAHRPESQGLRI
jgi:hypothetical protein